MAMLEAEGDSERKGCDRTLSTSSPAGPSQYSSPKASPILPGPVVAVSALPDELLEQIIILSVALDFQVIHKQSMTLRYISQVCQRWRNMAIGTPALWADSIDMGDAVRWNMVVRERAGQSRLTLVLPPVMETAIGHPCTYDGMRLSPPRLGDLLMRYDCRISREDLALNIMRYAESCRKVAVKLSDKEFRRFIGQILPDLHGLESVTVVRYTPVPGYNTAVLLPKTIPSAEEHRPSRLRFLDLRGCGTYLSSPIYHLLEELTLQDLPISASIRPASFITILKNMKGLRRLELINATLTSDYYTFGENEITVHEYREPPFYMSHLRSIKLDAPLHHCSSLMKNIIFPATCDVCLSCSTTSSLRDSFSSLMASLEHQFRSDNPRVLGPQMLVALTRNSCVVRTRGHKDILPEKCIPSFSLSLWWYQRTYIPTQAALMSVAPTIHPQDVLSAAMVAIHKGCETVMELELLYNVTSDSARHLANLDEIMRPFTALKRLKVVLTPTLAFLLPILMPVARDENVEVALEPNGFADLLLSLEAIAFSSVEFGKLAAQDQRPLTRLVSFVGRRSLKSIRGTKGNPAVFIPRSIDTLTFHLCAGIREKAVAALENLGVEVIRDGFTFGCAISKCSMHHIFY